MATEHPHLTRDSRGRLLPDAQIIANVEARYKAQWDRERAILQDENDEYKRYMRFYRDCLCIPLPRVMRRLRTRLTPAAPPQDVARMNPYQVNDSVAGKPK